MKTEHTPEPWGLRDDYKGSVYFREQCVARCCEPQSEANARRIVACVNACAGIPTEMLERFKAIVGAMDEVSKIEKQRDELLAAAEAIEIDAEECLDFDECTAMLVPIDTYHKLMEAIASVKEK